MSRTELDTLVAQIRAMREQTLAECADLTEADFALPTGMPRWDDARRVLLRFGDHMREHASQAQAARVRGRSCADTARTHAGRGRAGLGHAARRHRRAER